MGTFDLKDLGGLSRPLSKLIDGLRSACGRAYEPSHIVRLARARREATLIDAQTEGDAEQIRRRALDRVEDDAIRQQENLDKVVGLATQQLPDAVSDEPVDPDWFHRFVREAKDVSDEQVQMIYARVLAGETERPGSYSFRTLDVLRSLTRTEAETFRRFAGVSCDTGRRSCVLFSSDAAISPVLKSAGVTGDAVVSMGESGLLEYGLGLSVTFPANENATLRFMNQEPLLVKTTAVIAMPVMLFTSAGRQLLAVTDAQANQDYVKTCRRLLTSYGAELATAPSTP